jgi:hypothetical protein
LSKKGINFAKDSYNKIKLMGFFLKDKKLLTTFKKHSYPKICGIVKL